MMGILDDISRMPGAPIIEVLIIAALFAIYIFVLIIEEKWS